MKESLIKKGKSGVYEKKQKFIFNRKEKEEMKRLFTLIELLVVIAIIAVITNNCIVANFNNLFN